MRHLGTVVFVLMTFTGDAVGAVDAAKDPKSIAGVPWFANRSAVVEQLGIEERACHDMSLVGAATEIWCDYKLPFEKRDALSMQFMLIDDKLIRVRIIYHAHDFEFVKDVLATKYGPPSSARSADTYTRGGAKVTNSVLDWKFPTATIEMRRFADTTRAGAAYITLNTYLEELRARETAAKRKAVDAF